MAVFEHIEKLKRDYTDKFVLVDDRCAELARFKGQTGRVKTVNMNGRALVEFDHFENIGWFDIDVDYLKVIDRPAPLTRTNCRVIKHLRDAPLEQDGGLAYHNL